MKRLSCLFLLAALVSTAAASEVTNRAVFPMSGKVHPAIPVPDWWNPVWDSVYVTTYTETRTATYPSTPEHGGSIRRDVKVWAETTAFVNGIGQVVHP